MPQDVRNPAQPAPLPATLPATKTPAQGQERTYQVPQNGETFWEISRKTLGNPNRWSEIRRLNPKIEPQYPVPGGTILKMPPDARLGSVAQTPLDKVN
jgi:nucleoid-associated protein YgaU